MLHLLRYFSGIQFKESSVRRINAEACLQAEWNHGFVRQIYLLIFRTRSIKACFFVSCGHNTSGTPSPPPNGPQTKGTFSLYINVGSHIVPKVTANTIENLCCWFNLLHTGMRRFAIARNKAGHLFAPFCIF